MMEKQELHDMHMKIQVNLREFLLLTGPALETAHNLLANNKVEEALEFLGDTIDEVNVKIDDFNVILDELFVDVKL